MLGGGYSANTNKHYTFLLNKLTTLNIDYENAKTIEPIIEKIQKNSKVSPTTIRVYFQAILWSKKNTDKDFLKSVSTYITQVSKDERKKRGENILMDNEKQNYIDWNHILKIYKKVELEKNESQFDLVNFVILSLYVLFPPRRLSDYSNMVISFDDKYKVNTGLSKQFDANNYYSYKKHLFIFNNYKTNKKVSKIDGKQEKIQYKQQVFKVPTELSDILDSYIELLDLKGSLLGFKSPDSLSTRLKNIFKDYINKNISVNILRHSYISYVLSNRQKFNHNNLYLISTQMAHSMQTQSEYYKNN
jgi:hypothetical protein